mgnify:CR=1 FL=1
MNVLRIAASGIALRNRPSNSRWLSAEPPRRMRFNMSGCACCSGMST